MASRLISINSFAQTVTKMSCLRSPYRLAASASQRNFCCLAVGVAVLLSGCGQGPKAEFSLRDATGELIPAAQKVVKKTLDEKFGTPQNLVAWQRFPVSYGGVQGSVAAVSKDGVTTSFEGDLPAIHHGAPLLWLSGSRAGTKTSVDSVATFDAVTKQLKWTGNAEPAPVVGDKFVIGYGSNLQTGRVVYMKNCMHCHGVAGDGAGPTAQFLNPLPRDYRLGLFKFTSTLTPEKPTRDDLTRVIQHGIPGTYMPSFRWLGDKETTAVVEYVRWLSMRGEFEKRIDDDMSNDYSAVAMEASAKKANEAYQSAMKTAKKEDRPEKPKTANQLVKVALEEFAKYEKDDLPGVIDDTATLLAESWKKGEEADSLIVPTVARVTDNEASRERGKRLYLSDKGKCYTCHGVQGRGDGVATEDFWKKPGSDEYYAHRGLHDTWGRPLQPRNLTLGQYRGGRRPIDVFRRIYAGIKGTPMPGFGRTALKDEEIWDIVNYVMSLQFQSAPTKSIVTEHTTASK